MLSWPLPWKRSRSLIAPAQLKFHIPWRNNAPTICRRVVWPMHNPRHEWHVPLISQQTRPISGYNSRLFFLTKHHSDYCKRFYFTGARYLDGRFVGWNRPLIVPDCVYDLEWRQTRGWVESAIYKNDNKCLRYRGGTIRVPLCTTNAATRDDIYINMTVTLYAEKNSDLLTGIRIARSILYLLIERKCLRKKISHLYKVN